MDLQLAGQSSGGASPSLEELNARLRKEGLENKAGSEVNQWHTPQNVHFYSNHKYLHLNSQRREIRLLKIHRPKTYRDHIRDNPSWAPLPEEGEDESLDLDDHDAVSRHLEKHGINDPSRPIIACELEDRIQLNRVGNLYHTLSYCAGSPNDTAVILVDGIPFNAFANLEQYVFCFFLESFVFILSRLCSPSTSLSR
jgi:hypothetical protein